MERLTGEELGPPAVTPHVREPLCLSWPLDRLPDDRSLSRISFVNILVFVSLKGKDLFFFKETEA